LEVVWDKNARAPLPDYMSGVVIHIKEENMLKKLGNGALGAGYIALGAAFFVATLALPVLFIKGAMWASGHLLGPLVTLGWWVLAVTFLVALPLAISKRMRGSVAIAIMYSSFVYGLIAWLTGFVITYDYWGIFGVVFGLFFFGVGVVPLGLLASAFHGWDGFVPLLVLVVLTFGSRIGAFALASSAENNSRDWESDPEWELALAVAESQARIELADSERKILKPLS